VSCSGKDESCHSVRWSLGPTFLPRVSGGSSGDDPKLVWLAHEEAPWRPHTV